MAMKANKYKIFKSFRKYLALIVTFGILIFYAAACSNEVAQDEKDMQTAPSTVSVPFSAEECVGMDTDTLEDALYTAGFSNISTETVEDLTSAEAEKLGKVQTVEIGGSTSFLKEEGFEEDIEVVIYRHDFKECNIIIKTDFTLNLLFNRYDVDVFFDDELIGTMEHGVDGTFECSAYPGEYTLLFESTTTVAEGETVVSIAWDTEVSYKIACGGDEIVITQLYKDESVALKEEEIKLDKAANEYISENYQSVADSFEEMGFTDIKCTPLYDIIWGITEEGSIEDVSIGGSTEYSRGDIVTKDTPIVITYHVPIEDDPTKARMVEDSEDYTGKDYLDVQAELKSLGFKNIVLVQEKTFDLSKSDGSIITVLANNEEFYDGERLDKDVKVVITYWKTEQMADVQNKSEQNPSTDVILPPSGSKLAKDLDYVSEYTACYINVDGVSNKPSLKKWNTTTVTDGVAQYLDYLEERGFTIQITDQITKEPYAGYHYYETDFQVFDAEASWTMTLIIQDEDYTEYQLDIDLS